MALNAAHRGYLYQDLVTACYFVHAVFLDYKKIMVDKKLFKGDSLDDLTIVSKEKIIRSQFKYSQNRILQLKDIKSEDGSISIVDIIKSHLEFKEGGDKEYRLCLAWDEPNDGEFGSILEKVECAPSLAVLETTCYKLNIDELWPANGTPTWDEIAKLKISRDEMLQLCETLIIELNWPKASLDLKVPGVLERYLVNLLEEKIGIGKYPNENRNAIDVAATLIRLANICRAESRIITPIEIINQLGIRTDFGKVAQRNIVDSKRYVNREDILEGFLGSIDKSFAVLVGTPGSGKSWLLSMLHEQLRQKFLVAKHYCYLEPGDEDVQRRITTNVMFGNLISDLLQSEEGNRYTKKTLFSADEEELNFILEQASADNEKVYLIVDGLDHISRVFNSTTDLSLKDIDIVEKLMRLKVPHNVHIILGTQPGKHLEPLSKLDSIHFYEMPAWEVSNIQRLFINYDLDEVISKLVESEIEFYEKIKNKTEGNPLYITFLIKSLLMDIESKVIDLEEFINNIPLIDGDIRNYYEYLIRATEDTGAILVGEILSAVDFGVTEAEIIEVSGPYTARMIPPAVKLLSPILVNVSAQGGIRIYHESFKRFILERSEQNGVSIRELVVPIIEWLKKKDFYLDSKAYEFLFSLLKKGGLQEEIKSIVDSEFIIKSIAHCQPRKNIEKNLLIASNAAKDLNDFKLQIRINELKKSLYVAYEEKLMDIRLYGNAFGMMYGFDLLAERLILDGRITLDISTGLILCDLIDQKGYVAPWKEYCEAFRNKKNEDNIEVNLAFFKGVLKVEPWNEKYPILTEWFGNLGSNFERSYMKGIIKVLLDLQLNDFIYEILTLELNLELKKLIQIELLKYLFLVDKVKAKELLKSFTSELNGEDLIELLTDFREVEVLKDMSVENPEEIELFINSHISSAENIHKWCVSVRACAAKNNRTVLQKELARVSGSGWYKKWLTFVIETAQVEFMNFESNLEKEKKFLTCFNSLLDISSPFEGKPRTCDLYSIETYIYNSFEKGLRNIYSESGWEEVLIILEKVSQKTTTYLMGSAGGPLTSSRLIQLLDSFAHIDAARKAICKSMERINHKASDSGQYFEIQAEHEMYFSIILNKMGNKEFAYSSWSKACRYLCSYGFHKDITIYELLYSVEYFIDFDDVWIKEELLKILQLLNNVSIHTDGKEIRYIHNEWFNYLLRLDFNLATKILAQSLKCDGGVIDWRLEDAIEDVAINSYNLIPQDLFIVLVLSCNVQFNYELIEKLLEAVKTIKEIDALKFEKLYTMIKSKVYESNLEQETLKLLDTFDSQSQYTPGIKERLESDLLNNEQIEHCLSNASIVDLNIFINSLGPKQLCNDSVINAIGYKMVEYSANGTLKDIEGIIDLLAKKLRLYNRELCYVFESLRLGLERYNVNEPVIYLAILQYTRVYDKGWSYFGGKETVSLIEKNYKLHSEYIDKVLQDELELNVNSYIPTFGVTSNLIYLFVRLNIDLAKELWAEAFEVISLRLKTDIFFSGPFINYENLIAENSTSECVIELIMSRITHPELKRRTWALFGMQYSYFNYENDFINALDDFVKTDIYESTLEVILSLLLEKEIPSQVLSKEWIKVLLTLDYYSINELAHFILDIPTEKHSVDLEINFLTDFDDSILSLDRNQSAINVESYLSNIIERTCTSFENIFDKNEVYLKKMQGLFKAFTDSRGRKLPIVHYWGIENEIYKQTLNREVFKHANNNPLILTHMVSDISIPIAMKYSKIRRPQNVIVDLENKNPQRSNLEGYEDWITIASIENEVIFDEGYFANMKSIKSIYRGLVSGNIKDIKSNRLPIKRLEDIDWWYVDKVTNQYLPKHSVTFLSSYGIVYNDFGEHRLLKLQDSILDVLNLKAADFPGPFDLLDQNNKVAVAYRNWECDLIGTDLEEETFIKTGFELVMRPDIFEEVLKIYNGNLHFLSKEVNKLV